MRLSCSCRDIPHKSLDYGIKLLNYIQLCLEEAKRPHAPETQVFGFLATVSVYCCPLTGSVVNIKKHICYLTPNLVA